MTLPEHILAPCGLTQDSRLTCFHRQRARRFPLLADLIPTSMPNARHTLGLVIGFALGFFCFRWCVGVRATCKDHHQSPVFITPPGAPPHCLVTPNCHRQLLLSHLPSLMPHISGLSTCAPDLQPPGTRVHLVAGDIPDHPVGSQGEVLALGVNGLLYGLPGPRVSEAGVHAQLVRPPEQLHASTADAVTCVCVQ